MEESIYKSDDAIKLPLRKGNNFKNRDIFEMKKEPKKKPKGTKKNLHQNINKQLKQLKHN